MELFISVVTRQRIVSLITPIRATGGSLPDLSGLLCSPRGLNRRQLGEEWGRPPDASRRGPNEPQVPRPLSLSPDHFKVPIMEIPSTWRDSDKLHWMTQFRPQLGSIRVIHGWILGAPGLAPGAAVAVDNPGELSLAVGGGRARPRSGLY